MKKKRQVLFTLALGAAVSFSAGLFALDTLEASAEITVDETTKVANAGFEMQAGASVRRVDTNGDKVNDQVGIRFATEVSSEFETYLSTTYEGASFEYGTLITAQNVLAQNGKTITDMTVENKADLQCNNPTDEVEDGKFYGSVLYTSENGVDWENLTDAQKLAIYKTELVARSYVKITQGDNVSYIYAKAEDTVRSIRGVANAAILDNDGELLEEYIGQETREESSFDYYDPDVKTGDISVEELADGTYTLYVNAKCYGNVAVENGTFKLPALAAMAAGEHSVSLFDANANVYSTPFVYPTKVLKKASDLAMFNLNNAYGETPTAEFDGYYILGNDIDASENGYTQASVGYLASTTTYKNVGLTGTFNGMGHQISHLTFSGDASQLNGAATSTANYKQMDYSLFGLVCGGTIKNLGLVDVSFNVTEGITMAERAVLANSLQNATVENVYVQVSGFNYGDPSFNSTVSGVAGHINDKTVMTNCIFDIYDDGTVQTFADKVHNSGEEYYYLMAAFGALTADGGKQSNNQYTDVTGRNWKNVYVVSPLALSHEKSNDKAHWEWYGANLNKTESTTAHSFVEYENVTQYLSHEDMVAADIDYETLGFTADKGWKIVDGCVPTWNGVKLEKTVNYTVNLDDEKTQLSEDDLYALFGDKKATLLSASTSDSTYGISYTAGALSVTGAEWNGETFTAVFNDGNLEVTATVRLCTEVITSAEELGVFCLDNTDYATLATKTTVAGLTPTKVVNGYYVLGNDIDASTYAMPTQGIISGTHQSNMANVGFQGTFDGCGYTISNLTLGTDESDNPNYTSANRSLKITVGTTNYSCGWNDNTYSLFGIIGKNAVVKNFGLTNVQFGLKNGTLTMYKAACSGLAMWIESGAMVENVYVSIKGITTYYDVKADASNIKTHTNVLGLAYGIYSGATLNNVVVDTTYTGEDVLQTNKNGALVYRLCASDKVSTTWTNTYALSSYDLAGSTTANQKLFAANSGSTTNVVSGVYQYASLEAWKAAQDSEATATNFDSFKNGFWTVDKVPTWN